MIDERLPLFNISADVFNSLVFEDVKKTSKDMWDLGIHDPPFNNFFPLCPKSFVFVLRCEARGHRKLKV